MPLRICLVRAQLSMMIEVPAGELTRGNAARNRVEPTEDALRRWSPALEHVVVHDLVQKNREIENCESLHDGERDPDERVVEADERPGDERQNRELSCRDEGMAPGRLAVQLTHELARNGRAQLGAQRSRVLRVIT